MYRMPSAVLNPRLILDRLSMLAHSIFAIPYLERAKYATTNSLPPFESPAMAIPRFSSTLAATGHVNPPFSLDLTPVPVAGDRNNRSEDWSTKRRETDAPPPKCVICRRDCGEIRAEDANLAPFASLEPGTACQAGRKRLNCVFRVTLGRSSGRGHFYGGGKHGISSDRASLQ